MMASHVAFILAVCILMGSPPTNDCLECYQCSDKLDSNSHCDDYLWHSLTGEKKGNLIVGCRPEMSKYCIKIETDLKGNRITERGCCNESDSEGNMLKEGCIDTTNHKICFCSTSLCNLGNSSKLSFWELLSAVIFTLKPYFHLLQKTFQ